MLALVLMAAAGAAEIPFEPSSATFADAAGCRAHLAAWVSGAGGEAAVGPYEVGPGDVRAHVVRVSGSGHRITEQRCAAEKLSSRSWRHAMEDGGGDRPETIDDMAAKAEWLKTAPRR